MNRVVAEVYTGFTAMIISAINTGMFPFTGLFGGDVQPNLARISFEGSGMRFSIVKGFTATSGSGHLVSAGDVVTLHGSDAVRAFNVAAAGGTGNAMASLGYL